MTHGAPDSSEPERQHTAGAPRRTLRPGLGIGLGLILGIVVGALVFDSPVAGIAVGLVLGGALAGIIRRYLGEPRRPPW